MTAVAIAHGRALETARADRLFADPWVGQFVRASGWTPPTEAATAAGRAGAGGAAWVVVRTRFLDDVVLDAAGHGCAQVVLLGAGLDTRTLRLAWPAQTRLFELDTEEVFAFKETVLAQDPDARPSCEQRILVRADVTGDWPARLRAARHDPSVPTMWVAEGLLLYLTEHQNDILLQGLTAVSPPGSRFAATLTPPGNLAAAHAADQNTAATHAEPVENKGSRDPLSRATVHAMWRSDGPEDPVGWLAGYGWDAEVFHPAERAHAYGRGPAPSEPLDPPRRLLVTAYKSSGQPAGSTSGNPRSRK